MHHKSQLIYKTRVWSYTARRVHHKHLEWDLQSYITPVKLFDEYEDGAFYSHSRFIL